MATKKIVKTASKIKKYKAGGPGKGIPGESIKDFKTDSTTFRNNEKLYSSNPSLQLQNKIVQALQKYGSQRLTGTSPYIISDMAIQKKGGSVKNKKVIKSKKK